MWMTNWKEIDDTIALRLLNEIFENIAHEGIFLRENSSALEKRYGKTIGTITDLIFYEDIKSSEEILAKLKTDTRIML